MNSTGESTGEDGEQEEQREETEEEYRLRVYGTADDAAHGGSIARRRRSSRNKAVRASFHAATSTASAATSAALRHSSSSARHLSRRLSRQISRRSSSIVESLPDTPAGWVTLATTTASAILAYELRLQRSLTSPPLVFCQGTVQNERLRRMLSTPADGGVLSRSIKPSLLVGTRGMLASVAAYAVPHRDDDATGAAPTADGGGGGRGSEDLNSRLHFREIMHMGADGAKVAIDWEVPPEHYPSTLTPRKTVEQRKSEILVGPISRTVVIILHGINNDASFGYVRSLMKACTDRGWIAVGYNFRGCGGISLNTPRGYTGGYTGDLRCTVNQIVPRMADESVPIFVVGNSLGANLITKYLGEEGRSGTLPRNVAGGISLGNPLHIHSGNMRSPWAEILGLGVKKMILLNWSTMHKMSCFHYRDAHLKALFKARTIGQVDDVLAPFMIRNEPDYPFAVKVGYQDGEDYWDDASSYRYVQFVSVPLLKVTAQDDFLVYGNSLRKMSHCLESPNVFVVKTKCGGHLGWQEAPPDTGNVFGFGTSWADTATTDFIAAVIQLREEKDKVEQRKATVTGPEMDLPETSRKEEMSEALLQATKIRSKL